jgi:hypothetical protein
MNLSHLSVLIGVALLTLIAAMLKLCRRPQCCWCASRDISQDAFGYCICRTCGHEWNPFKGFGSAHADM